MTDCTSPDWLQDAINAIQDLDTAQDLVDGVASLQQENERLRGVVGTLSADTARGIAGYLHHEQAYGLGYDSICAYAMQAALLTGGE